MVSVSIFLFSSCRRDCCCCCCVDVVEMAVEAEPCRGLKSNKYHSEMKLTDNGRYHHRMTKIQLCQALALLNGGIDVPKAIKDLNKTALTTYFVAQKALYLTTHGAFPFEPAKLFSDDGDSDGGSDHGEDGGEDEEDNGGD